MPEAAAGETRVLRTLGLARRAGRAVVGTRAVLEAADDGELELLVLAGDTSANTVRRVDPARRAAAGRVARISDKASLGGALGRGLVAVVGVTDEGLATKVEEEMDAAAPRESGNDERSAGKKEPVRAADDRRERELT